MESERSSTLTRPRPSSLALELAKPPISRDQNETMPFGNCLDSPAVERALAEVEGLSDPLVVVSRLRASLPTPLARAAASLHDLRGRAQSSALDRDLRFLTPKGLQQATAGAVAAYRAHETLR